ncbi:hypothetical protein F5141DRAFT_1100773 [Pisolithus sp. B1]|nr:hypothetical protein F5141DRAFT_1100773 [Pisolithus sp. B1]
MCVVVLLIFVGTTLQQRNDMVQQNNEKEWAELRSHLAERTTNINILGGLALGASATFLTSHAPTDIADWNRQFPYFFIAAANYSAMLSVLSGLGLLINLNVMDLKSFEVSAIPSYSIFLLIPIALATTDDHRRCRRRRPGVGSLSCR